MNDSRPSDCPFCELPPARILAENSLSIAIADAFPVSRGHTLVISRRHVESFFELSEGEAAAIVELTFRVQETIRRDLSPDGFNVGINVGAAAGQTIMHVHLHLIPRYHADVADPRGGVRHVLPGKGLYP